MAVYDEATEEDIWLEERGGGGTPTVEVEVEVKDKIKVQAQTTFQSQLENEARRANAKGGNGRVKHSRSNAAVLSVLQGWQSVLCRLSVFSGTGRMGRPAVVGFRASRRLRNSNCHAATAMPCTTMGKSCWLSGEGRNLTGSD